MIRDESHTIKSDEAGFSPGRKSRTGVVVTMLAPIGAFYLLREHWGHVAGNWPYLLLLLCPLMHLFHGHGGHGGHGRHKDGPENQ